MLRSLDGHGWVDTKAVKAAVGSAYVERVNGVLSRLAPPPPTLRPNALKRQTQTEEGEILEEGLNPALHKSSPHQGEKPRPRRVRRWLWPVVPP